MRAVPLREKETINRLATLPSRLHLGKPQAPSGPAGWPQRRGPRRRAGVRRAACRGRDLRPGGSLWSRARSATPEPVRAGAPKRGHLTHRCRASAPRGVGGGDAAPDPLPQGGERRERASRTHLGAHLPREPALRPGLALPLQRLRGKGKESSLPREPPQPPSPAPHQLGAPTHYLARGR